MAQKIGLRFVEILNTKHEHSGLTAMGHDKITVDTAIEVCEKLIQYFKECNEDERPVRVANFNNISSVDQNINGYGLNNEKI